MRVHTERLVFTIEEVYLEGVPLHRPQLRAQNSHPPELLNTLFVAAIGILNIALFLIYEIFTPNTHPHLSPDQILTAWRIIKVDLLGSNPRTLR